MSNPSPAPPLLLLSPLMLLPLRLPSPNLAPMFLSQVTSEFSSYSSLQIFISSLTCPASSGVQGAWPDADITPVPLLSSPDLDSLCDPATPVLSNSFPRSSPPCSATLPPPPLSAPSGTAAPAVFDKISYITNLFRSWSFKIL